MSDGKFLTVYWGALFHRIASVICFFTAALGTPAVLVYLLLVMPLTRYMAELHLGVPYFIVYGIAVIAAMVGAVLLVINLSRRIPLTCPRCGGRSYGMKYYDLFACSSCGHKFGIISLDWSGPWARRCTKVIKTSLFVVLAPVVAFMMVIMLGIGGPIVFLMFFGAYFVIGPLLQILVRLVPQDHPSNQPTPWGQYLGIAFTMVLRTGAVLAFFRLLLALSGLKSTEPGNAMFNPVFDYFFGGCGILYAVLSFGKEGFWHLQQVFAVRDLPRSTVAAASMGLTELSGVVRHVDNRDGIIDPGRTVMSFSWQILGTEPGYGGRGKMLGSYRKDMHPFYLDDGTGKILVDPAHNGVELRRPFISVATTFFGRRSFEILLTKHLRKHSLIEREYELKEGDAVYVIGNVEVWEDAPADAVDSERLVVRPREQARKGLESLLQFLIPFGKKPARTVHDVFVIADTKERRAKGLLMKNFLFSTGISLLMALLSIILIVIVQ